MGMPIRFADDRFLLAFFARAFFAAAFFVVDLLLCFFEPPAFFAAVFLAAAFFVAARFVALRAPPPFAADAGFAAFFTGLPTTASATLELIKEAVPLTTPSAVPTMVAASPARLTS